MQALRDDHGGEGAVNRDALQHTAEPLHLQVKSRILKAIGDGDWPPNTQIASEREICVRYNVSRTTTRCFGFISRTSKLASRFTSSESVQAIAAPAVPARA